MAVTLKQAEAVPGESPLPHLPLSHAASDLNRGAVWARIEAYTVHRWTPRAVVWTVEGPGDWVPPLAPATVATVEVWTGTAWTEAFPAASPLGGYVLACEGPYRITAEVGGGDVPAAVQEAFRRLAEYMAEGAGRGGASSEKTSVGPVDIEVSRNPAWLARAMQYSGAGDLLRPWREAV